MEKENLPYRWLRNQKKKSSAFTRKSLLVPLKHRQEDEKMKAQVEGSIMSQNVSQYLHMLSDCHMKESYIKWATNLRSSSLKNPNSIQREGSAPGAYYKKTTSSQLKTENTDSINRHPFNAADYTQYMCKKKQSGSFFNQSCLSYMVSLREYNGVEQKKGFCSIPKKQRNQIPTFLKQENLKKTTAITKQDKEPAFDGSHMYPNYTENILRDKNYGLLSTFTTGKNKTSLPNLAWQVGLRSY